MSEFLYSFFSRFVDTRKKSPKQIESMSEMGDDDDDDDGGDEMGCATMLYVRFDYFIGLSIAKHMIVHWEERRKKTFTHMLLFMLTHFYIYVVLSLPIKLKHDSFIYLLEKNFEFSFLSNIMFVPLNYLLRIWIRIHFFSWGMNFSFLLRVNAFQKKNSLNSISIEMVLKWLRLESNQPSERMKKKKKWNVLTLIIFKLQPIVPWWQSRAIKVENTIH